MLDAILNLARELFFFAGYVSGGCSFPPQLSPEEERCLIERLSNGDCEARCKLIEHNLRLVAHIAKKYSAPRRDADDLISIGTVGLIKAVSTFKPDRGNTLATYAARCIEKPNLTLWPQDTCARERFCLFDGEINGIPIPTGLLYKRLEQRPFYLPIHAG
ncbi:MAG: sigma-70 family RNA polymerase sigma factor [Clostridia bacterium]|nr:sigma-70 family RNA polymerase sigma factor [Clostridia bacterium]